MHRLILWISALSALVALISSVPAAQAASTRLVAAELTGGQLIVRYEGARPLSKRFLLRGPERYVIDLPGTVVACQSPAATEQLQVRIGQFQPGIARVVLQHPSAAELGPVQLSWSAGRLTIQVASAKASTKSRQRPNPYRKRPTVDQDAREQSKTSSPNDETTDQQTGALTDDGRLTATAENQFLRVERIGTLGTQARLRISRPDGQAFGYRLLRLSGPARLVVDLPGWSDYDPLAVSRIRSPSPLIWRIRAGRPDPQQDLLRLVFDLSGNALQLTKPAGSARSVKALTLTLTGPVPELDAELRALRANVRQGLKVVLDAGHGGYDVGAMHGQVLEKELTLKLTNQIANQLSELGVTVVKTRPTDEFISLDRRVELTREAKPDLFVSIHCNALNANDVIAGIETYYYTPQSLELAKVMHRELVNSTGANDRRVRKARFVVIRETLIPSVLLELGFLTNPQERAQLVSPSYQQKLVNAVSSGILRYLQPAKEEQTTDD